MLLGFWNILISFGYNSIYYMSKTDKQTDRSTSVDGESKLKPTLIKCQRHPEMNAENQTGQTLETTRERKWPSRFGKTMQESSCGRHPAWYRHSKATPLTYIKLVF